MLFQKGEKSLPSLHYSPIAVVFPFPPLVCTSRHLAMFLCFLLFVYIYCMHTSSIKECAAESALSCLIRCWMWSPYTYIDASFQRLNYITCEEIVTPNTIGKRKTVSLNVTIKMNSKKYLGGGNQFLVAMRNRARIRILSSRIVLHWVSCTINIGAPIVPSHSLSHTRVSHLASTHERTHFGAHTWFWNFKISTVSSWPFCEFSWA